MFEVNNKNKHTEKWKLDIVEWLENNCSEHFNSKIVADYMIDKIFFQNEKNKTLWDN